MNLFHSTCAGSLPTLSVCRDVDPVPDQARHNKRSTMIMEISLIPHLNLHANPVENKDHHTLQSAPHEGFEFQAQLTDNRNTQDRLISHFISIRANRAFAKLFNIRLCFDFMTMLTDTQTRLQHPVPVFTICSCCHFSAGVRHPCK